MFNLIEADYEADDSTYYQLSRLFDRSKSFIVCRAILGNFNNKSVVFFFMP